MELIKPEVARFEFKDIVFLVRSKATLGDRMAIEALTVGAIQAVKAGGIEGLPKLGREIVKLFVCGWEGVTLDGKAVPYSYDLLVSSFPADIADELMPQLCKFVAANVDVLQQKP